MKKLSYQIKRYRVRIRRFHRETKRQLRYIFRRYAWRVALLSLVTLAVYHWDISVTLGMNALAGQDRSLWANAALPLFARVESEPQIMDYEDEITNVSQVTDLGLPEALHSGEAEPANTFSNLPFGGDSSGGNAGRKEKVQKQKAYIRRFASIAQEEMKKYQIPASIILAQGLLESNAGESRLAMQNNNHFGIKCFQRACNKGHCTNFEDDHHKDFFRKYSNAWESYRAHSLLLKGKRYRHLSRLGARDFRGWAHGLKRAGYATDPRYAEKLILLIEERDLHQYDR